jgi:hypothetical protein
MRLLGVLGEAFPLWQVNKQHGVFNREEWDEIKEK